MNKVAAALVLVAVALVATAQGPPAPPPPLPVAWEYKVVPNFDASSLETILNKHAAAGWEVAHTVGGNTIGNVILKRPKR